MIKYAIKQKIVTEPKIELPEGSLPVSVKHNDAYDIKLTDMSLPVPECWQVIWLEPEPES